MGYIWNDDLFAYVDEDTGQPVSEARVRELSETTAQLSRTKTAAIVAAIITAPSLLEVRTQINTELKFSYSRQYMLGRGGRSRMEPSDYQRLGNAIREQYSYLDNFIDAIQADLLSEPQIEHRMNLYWESGRSAYSKGRMANYGQQLELPAHPGDGTTFCRANCKCWWHIDVLGAEGWEVTWNISPVENCDTCVARYEEWNPLPIGPSGQADAAFGAHLFA